MSITLKPYLLKRRQKANGLYPIYIRITENGKYSLYSTGIDIELKDWNPNAKPGKWVRSGEPSSDVYNFQIQNLLSDIRAMIRENDKITRKQIVHNLKDTGNGEFLSFAEQFAEAKKEKGQYHQHKHIHSLIRKMKEHAGNDIRFKDITALFLEDFKDWMQVTRGNHPNTISKEMSRLKSVLNDAVKKGLTGINPFNSPEYEPVKKVRSTKKALSIKQIDDIESLELEKGSSLWHVRNYFLFSFYCAGIRFSDFAFLKWENIQDGRLIYTMGKNQKQKSIELLPPAQQILDYYRVDGQGKKDFIFPIIKQKNLTELGLRMKAGSANAVVNRDLKDLQKLAGIDTNISFHIARHSFSRWAKAKGLSLDFIGKALNHSKRATTEQYLDDLADYDMDNDMQELYNSKAKK